MMNGLVVRRGGLYLAIPIYRLTRKPDFNQIIIIRPISEPSSHLHERVVHIGISIEVGNN